ncbi:hypothetical protein QNI16_37340 [Cytophagaceae bacterium YF14B1]|uniref:Uncharacterized protein n=1 Tax=Xanthocytophaga flava TaxID=3048013 RepID=A0AAE3QZC6_9BACT|nr:hypothetical protein [Xanthocytophaga flavus]MDJ1486208.1 hypothetical protein [Xanthocytophaga flavus]
MTQDLTVAIKTDKNIDNFQVRFLTDEGVGLLTTRTGDNYLILDSLDYWYDLIQNEYPKKKKCSCKNEWFRVQFTYIQDAETNTIREVNISATCSDCGKVSKPMSVEINYSPTDTLLSAPLTYCEKPNIKYKFTEWTSYWEEEDLKNFLHFVFFDLKLHMYCWFFKHLTQKKVFEKVSFEDAMRILTGKDRYLDFYFSQRELEPIDYINFYDETNGVVLKLDIWRKNEIIQLSSPTRIMDCGLVYYIDFCNQYLDKGEVTDKSNEFEQITIQLKNWMKDTFVTKRGTHCFDGKEAYERFMAERNTE